MKIFISYTMKGGEINESYLKRINQRGATRGTKIFIDKLHNNDLNPQQRIEKEVKSSDVLILIQSNFVFKSDWVKKEIQIAREEGVPICFVKQKEVVKTLRRIGKLMSDELIACQ